MRSALGIFVLILAALATVATATAQPYPSRPVKVIVPYPPGGTNDILARIMGERLQKAMGQTFLIENRSGAGGVIGADAGAKAAPDGYTLLLSSSAPLAVGLGLYQKVPYDVVRDFSPVAMIADATITVVSYPGFKPQNINEVVAYAKANPGELKVALNSLGSMHHLLTEMFRLRTNTKINMIPYKGTGPAVVDLLAGHVDMDFENLPAVIQHIRGGRLRALAVGSAQRSELLPEVPTLKELGLTDLVAAPWFALVAPAGTPREIIVRLNAEVNKILSLPETKELLAKQGADPILRTPEETTAFIHQEVDKWARIVKESGAKLQ